MKAELIIIRCKEIASVCVGIFMKVLDTLLLAAFTCIVALGGCIMGTIAGGIKGHTTEVGILDGAGKGAVTGAIAALELLDLVGDHQDEDDDNEPLSKVALLSNIFNGKVLMEWIGTPETFFREVSDIYDIKGVPGLSYNLIQKLPLHQFNPTKISKLYNDTCCSICFQEFEDGELDNTEKMSDESISQA
ncbi:NEP1-interacting protein-like 1 [Senna tora]|uniref:NEP1-interacting protein-like 1 n=1 Tax=Senna tora TaxID=362788 RepID=A0A834T430_9FABA|nr:NEP1-interacting protein-like 1 [Senna tora]